MIFVESSGDNRAVVTFHLVEGGFALETRNCAEYQCIPVTSPELFSAGDSAQPASIPEMVQFSKVFYRRIDDL